ncbi:MAG: NAD-dependent epimerase/dehydratase family protein [Nitrospinota bacterium]
MNILVTGGAGFIGSNLADSLVGAGHKVIIADNLSTGRTANLNRKAIFHEVDIRDAAVEDIFREGKIEVIFHLAAQIDVRRSVAEPIYDAEINILGSLNILRMAVKYKVGRLIFSSTGGAIYGEQLHYPANEEHPLNPLSPYGVSKLSFEKYLYYAKAEYKLNYTVLRYANVYGPRQDPHGEAGVVAIFANCLLGGQVPTIYGNGEQTRDFVFVGDVVGANMLALEKSLDGTFNVGTGMETSVNTLCMKMIDIAGAKLKPAYAPGKPGEQRRSVIDPSKLISAGWRASVGIEEGLRKTIEYFRIKR